MSAPSRGPQLQDHVVDVEREAGGAGVKNLGVQKDIVERSSPLDSEVRDLAVATLTNDFLNVADLSLDLRAYLVETTLPSAVLALEKLIREVERRRLLEDDAQLTPAGGVALAAEDTILDPQPDKPLETTFNPINWLAQYLYRNNPRYSNFTDPLAAPYIASMQHIGDHLKARLFELHTNRRARLHAEELARKREDERMRKALLLKQEEKRNLFSELLCSVFRKWSSKNWRMAPGFLMKTEIIDALRAVLQADNIQSDDSMITKVSSLLNAFSTSPDVSEKARSAHEEQQKLARAADTGEKVELKPLWQRGTTPGSRPMSRGGLFGPQGYIPAEYLAVPKWTQEMFVESMIFIMGSADPEWTQEEMTVFLTVISTHIEEVFGKLLNDFAETVVVPKFGKLGAESAFSTTPNTPVDKDEEFSVGWAEGIKAEWKRRLGRLVEGLMNGEEVDPDLDVAEIKASMMDYCHGLVRVDPGTPASTVGTRVGTAAVVSWRAGSVSGSVLGGVVSTPDHQGDLGGSRPMSNAFEATSGILPAFTNEESGVRGNRPDTMITLMSVTNEVEEEYKMYLRVMIGLQGMRPFNVLMSYLGRMVMEQDLPGRTTGEEAVDRRGAMLEAFAAFVGVVRPETNPEGVVLPETLTAFYNKIMESSADVLQIQTTIDMVLERGGLDGRLRGILEMMKKMEEGVVQRRVVSGKEFAEIAVKACEGLDDKGVNELAGMLYKEFREAAETFAMLMNQGTSKETNSSTEGSGKPASKEIDRDRIERSAIGEITRLARRQTITIKEAANESLQVLTNALTALHPSHMVRGRLAVEDHTATAASPTESPRQFKFVACSEDIKEVLNSPMGDAETKVLRESKLVKEDGEDNDIVRRVEAGSPVSPSAVSKFLGVPMCSPVSGKPPKLVGMIGLTLSGDEDGGFNEPDVKFVETATTAILDTLDKVDRRLKAIALAESSLKYARELGDGEVNIYLNEPETWADPPKFFKVESFSTSTSFTADVEEGGKATDRPMSPKVSPMPAEDPITDLLVQTANEKELIDFAELDGRVTTFIPVIDVENHVVAVMSVKPLPGKKGEMNPEDLDDVRRVTSILASALNKIGKEKFGEDDEFSLEGERIDEDARRGLLFSKMMLMNARDLLGKLDNRALAELRSYKKPPAMIHKVCKAVLYVFGKLPKEVKLWSDTVKLINAELLKNMILYDPTAIQKKIRFKRCNRVLKRIPRGDVKNRGSTPAMYMHEWLLISLELRRLSVEARNRRPEVYQVLQQSALKSLGGEDEADDDEDADDDGSTRSGSADSKTNTNKESGGSDSIIGKETPPEREKGSAKGIREGGDEMEGGDKIGEGSASRENLTSGKAASIRNSPSRSSLKNVADIAAGGARLGSRGSISGLGSAGDIKRVQFSETVETSDGEARSAK